MAVPGVAAYGRVQAGTPVRNPGVLPIVARQRAVRFGIGADKAGDWRRPSRSPIAKGRSRPADHLSEFSKRILERRLAHAASVPPNGQAKRFVDDLLGLLFPHFSPRKYASPEEIAGQLALLFRDLTTILDPLPGEGALPVSDIVREFGDALPAIYEKLWLDAEAINAGDPAAESLDEVIAAYPGFLAIAIYRLAHEFHSLGVPVFPRILTEYAHQKTGIDIHPGAVIGTSFCIDHGTGVVVGETTTIGDHAKIYQGVTLGALSVDKSLSSAKRHPTIEDRVVVYSNATILGGATIVGHDSVIGGNVWLTESVPPFSVVYQKSEVRVRNLERSREDTP